MKFKKILFILTCMKKLKLITLINNINYKQYNVVIKQNNSKIKKYFDKS